MARGERRVADLSLPHWSRTPTPVCQRVPSDLRCQSRHRSLFRAVDVKPQVAALDFSLRADDSARSPVPPAAGRSSCVAPLFLAIDVGARPEIK